MPRFAGYDPAQPPPQPVMGWYDTDLFDYAPDVLPSENARIKLTDAQWDQRLDGDWAVERGRLLVRRPPPDPASLPPRIFAKQELLARLIAAKRLRNFRTVLALDTPDASALADELLELRERWLANDTFHADEIPLRATLTAADADPDIILKP